MYKLGKHKLLSACNATSLSSIYILQVSTVNQLIIDEDVWGDKQLINYLLERYILLKDPASEQKTNEQVSETVKQMYWRHPHLMSTTITN